MSATLTVVENLLPHLAFVSFAAVLAVMRSWLDRRRASSHGIPPHACCCTAPDALAAKALAPDTERLKGTDVTAALLRLLQDRLAVSEPALEVRL